jgi:ABC-2 type transport system ATP-binding protein
MSEAVGAALEISNLSKSYPTGFLHRQLRPALQGLNLSVQSGEIFGYLGPNGSGKTTTLKILMGVVFPDTGTASVLGLPHTDLRWRKRAGYLPEHPYFYDYLTPVEYLDYVGRLFEMGTLLRKDRAKMLLELVGLSRSKDVPLRRFSKGMVQRLGIAQALVNDPALVLLDEPMSGLDPIGRRSVRNLIRQLKTEGKTVFFSTHILPDAEALCDRVAVLRGGRLLDVGTLDSILNLGVSHVEIVTSGFPASGVGGLGASVRSHEWAGDLLRLDVDEGSVDQVLGVLLGGGGRIVAVQRVRQSLEDYFFREMGSGPAGERAWDD